MIIWKLPEVAAATPGTCSEPTATARLGARLKNAKARRGLLALTLIISSWASATEPARPNPKITPGDTQINDRSVICDPKFRTGPIRKVTDADKEAAFKRYGIARNPKEYEVDHLIPLTIGGANTSKNLWPQTYQAPGAHQKDLVEAWIRGQVCNGRWTLIEAQRMIAEDWYQLYKLYLQERKKK